jgi:hypothetical protein
LKHGGKEDAEENGFGGNAKQMSIDEVLRSLAMLAISRSRVHKKKAWIKLHPGHSTGKIYNKGLTEQNRI